MLVGVLAFTSSGPLHSQSPLPGGVSPDSEAASSDTAGNELHRPEPIRISAQQLSQRLRDVAQALDRLARQVGESPNSPDERAQAIDALWILLDSHSHQVIVGAHRRLVDQLRSAPDAASLHVPPGWPAGRTLGDVIAMDPKQYLALLLQSEAGRAVGQRLMRIRGVTRVIHPQRSPRLAGPRLWWTHDLLDQAWYEAWFRVNPPAAAEQAEGLQVEFLADAPEGDLGRVPSIATYEAGRWRIRLAQVLDR